MEEKIAIITGGNQGIGEATAKELYQQRYIVYSLARHESEEKGILSYTVDVCDTQRVKQVFMEIYKKHGKIDVLVNNAGIMEDALLGMITKEMMERQFQVNVFAVIELTQLVARFMKKKKSGCIVNLASIIGSHGNAGQSVYSATKGAVISFTKSAAKELAPEGIRVNAVAPGVIKTKLIEHVPEHLMEKRTEQIKIGRIGTPEEVAKVIAFLASENASYISGQIIEVDGCAVI